MDRRVERFLASPALSEATRRGYAVDVSQFCGWLSERGTDLDDFDARAFADYAAELGRRRPKLAPATIARKLAAVRALVRFALGPDRVPDRSFSPRRARRLPDAPKSDAVDSELAGLEGDGPLGLRNRALGELVYSAGLRSREAVDLDLGDVDFEQELVHVHGKGGKERAVPLGEEAAHWLARYLHEARPKLARGAENALFLSARGRLTHDPGAARTQLAVDDADLLARGRTPPAPRLRPRAPTLLASLHGGNPVSPVGPLALLTRFPRS